MDLVVPRDETRPRARAAWPRRRSGARRPGRAARGRRCRRRGGCRARGPCPAAASARAGVPVVEEGHRRLRPDHEARPAPRRLRRELQVPVDVVPGVLRHPLVLLPDAALHEADDDPARLRDRPAHRPGAPGPRHPGDEHGRPRRRSPPGGSRLQSRVGQEGREGRQDERHAVDRGHGRDLDDGQVRVLAVAEQAPRELEEGVRPEELGGHPDERGAEEARGAERARRAGPPPSRRARGKSAKARQSATMIAMPTARRRPPYWITTSAVQ